MVGNDIVDLNAALSNSRWEEQRFLDKLFTTHEQEFIFKSNSRFYSIWYLWSMKESVYKIVSRMQKLQQFNPKKYHCIMDSQTGNSVQFEKQYFQTDTLSFDGFIYTSAFLIGDGFFTKWICLSSDDRNIQHLEMKSACIKAFGKFKGIPENSIEIINNYKGIPQIYVDNILQNNCLSITHHGHYGGFSISK